MSLGEGIAAFFIIMLTTSFFRFLMECWEDKAKRRRKDKFLR